MKTNIRIIIITGILIFQSLKSNSQSISAVLDSMLDYTLDSVHNDMANKSLSAAIQMPNNFQWANAAGRSSSNPIVNANANHIYLIGSVTKTMTSACILQLAEQQILNLDDSLYEWTDTIPFIDPNITIRQLLRHESGLYDVLTNPQTFPVLQANPDSIWAAADLINTFIQSPLSPPGMNWAYCNTNYFLLGMIIHRATGNPFYTELRNRFFTPLLLNTIATPAFETVSSPVAHVWIDLNGDGVQDDAHSFYYNMLSLNSAGGAAGCYYSNAKDLSKWMRTYMRGDLLSPQMMAEAKTVHFAPGLPGAYYGLGLMRKFFLGWEAYGHGGDLSYSATSWYFPDFDISISVLNNDNQINSWELGPVVDALLQTYIQWNTINAVNDIIPGIQSGKAFPNPFSDYVNIVLPFYSEGVHTIRYELIDVNGKCIYKKEEQQTSSLVEKIVFNGLDDIPPGLYLLAIYQDEVFRESLKIVK